MDAKSAISGHHLSKSTFIRGLQCVKSLYLNKHHPGLRDEMSAEQQAIFSRGTDVGILAQELFPGGVDASPKRPDNPQVDIARTKGLIQSGASILYEAAFAFEGVLCYTDIMVKDGTNWKIYEVKSSTDLKDVYIPDAGIQYYIISHSGINVGDISIVHLNNDYVRLGDLDLRKLFLVRSVLPVVSAMLDSVPDTIGHFKEILSGKKIPEIDIGEHCLNPYECDFTRHCWNHIPENSVFDISGLRKTIMFDLYHRDIIKFEDVPVDAPLSPGQRLQVECGLSKRTHIDTDGIQSFLETLRYPLYFMDFETFMPAVPLFDNARPYQQITFQYSVHYQESRSTSPVHYEFLADTGSDPRPAFIKRLLGDTRGPGAIVVYNKSFEATRLGELARDFPAYSAEIEERVSRLIDLMEPFRKKFYYNPSMKGSYSIKAALPALVPGMDYSGMEIANGGAAMSAFEDLWHETDHEKIARIRLNLLEYCKMDTLAMIKVLDSLLEL